MSQKFDLKNEKMVILAEGSFGVLESKAATVLIRYHTENVVAVIDSTKIGKTTEEIIGIGKKIPIVASLDEAMKFDPTLLAIGIAPPGGQLPENWHPILVHAISNGLHVMSGMHHFLSDQPLLRDLAQKSGSILWDVRKPPSDLPIATCRAAEVSAKTILTVGSDCRTGKMLNAIELTNALRDRGENAGFCATGQNGIMISGWGIAIDAVISDFTAGAAEEIVLEGAKQHDILLIEGQGSLIHPGYSGVTLGLLHGSLPDAMIFCHQPSRKKIARYDVSFPPLSEMIRHYEIMAQSIKPSKVIGIALNTFDLDKKTALKAIDDAENETGLPATDLIRFGPEKLINRILEI